MLMKIKTIHPGEGLMNLKNIILPALSTLIVGTVGCSKSSDGGNGGGSNPLSQSKIESIAQAQAAIGNLGNDVKSSKSNQANKNRNLGLISTTELLTIASSEQSNDTEHSKIVKQKADFLEQKLRNSNCVTTFKPGQSSKLGNDEFEIKIGGLNCPMILNYSIKMEGTKEPINSESINAKGTASIEFKSLDQDLSKELDLSEMTMQMGFDVSSSMNQKTGQFSMKATLNYNGSGKSLSIGDYTVSLNVKTDQSGLMQTSPNQNTQPSMSGSAELSGSVGIGNETTTFLGQMTVLDNKTTKSVTQVNGQAVSEQEFTQTVQSLMSGLQINTNTNSSSDLSDQ